MIDKYDEMVASERDCETEDCYEDRLFKDNLKKKQEALCWKMKNKRYYTDYP